MNIDWQYNSEHIFSFLLAFVPAIINLVIAFFVFFRLPRRTVTTLFVIDLFFTALWQLGNAMTRISANEVTASFWDSMLGPFGLLCSPLILHFAVLFTKRGHVRIYMNIIYFAYFSTLILALLYPAFTAAAGHHKIHYWGWVSNRSDSLYHTILGLYLQLQYFFALGILISGAVRSGKGSNLRTQLWLMISALAIIIFTGLVSEALIPALFHHDPVPVTSAVILVYSAAVYIALSRHSLFMGIEAVSKEELLLSITDIIIVIGQEMDIAYINDAGLQKTGYANNEVTGLPLNEILKTDMPANGQNIISFQELLNENGFQNLKARLRSKDGSLKPVLVTSDALKTQSGTDGQLLVCRDITDLETAQTEARTRARYLQGLYEASPFAIIFSDPEGKIMEVNSAFTSMFQYQPDEAKGNLLENLIVPEDKKDTLHEMYLQLKRKNIVSYEARRCRKDKNLIDVFVIGYPVEADGEVIGSYILYIDISDKKASEKEILTKTREIDIMSETLDKFVYSASHDIRSPLMTILGIVNMAETDIEDAKSHEYFHMIRESVLKLDSFTRDIIRLSNNIHAQLEADSINLLTLVNDILESLKHKETQDTVIKVNIAPELVFISDGQRLQVILHQLISNALTFKSNFNKTHTVAISAAILPTKELQLIIEDNGEGITEINKSKIFDLFSRFSELSKGAGLGLYIVKEILSRLKGTIETESSPGAGTKFIVLIPSVEK